MALDLSQIDYQKLLGLDPTAGSQYLMDLYAGQQIPNWTNAGGEDATPYSGWGQYRPYGNQISYGTAGAGDYSGPFSNVIPDANSDELRQYFARTDPTGQIQGFEQVYAQKPDIWDKIVPGVIGAVGLAGLGQGLGLWGGGGGSGAAALGGGASDAAAIGGAAGDVLGAGTGLSAAELGQFGLLEGAGGSVGLDAAYAGLGGFSPAMGGAGLAGLSADTLARTGLGTQAAAPISASQPTSLGAGATTSDLAAYKAAGGTLTAAQEAALKAGNSLIPGISNSLLGTLAGGALGGISAATSPDSETVQNRPYIDPRVDQQLMGADGQPGVMQNILSRANTQLPAGMQAASGTWNDWLANQAPGAIQGMQGAIQSQMGGNTPAPQMNASQAAGASLGPFATGSAGQVNFGALPGVTPQQVQAGQINFGALPQAGAGGSPQGATASAQQMAAARLNDPSQQGTNLQSAFQDQIYGAAGSNPYLMQALQRAGDQSRYNFQNLLGDMGENYSENVLGNIRGGAIQAGGMGGSRQGIAEGMAAREYAKQAGRAATQYGQDLSSAMVGAQAGAYDTDRNRAAQLMGTLSGQQYGQEQQRAGLVQDAGKTNATLGTQAGIASAGNQTSANIAGANNQTQAGVANMNAMAGLLGQQAQLNQSASAQNAANSLSAQQGTQGIYGNLLGQQAGYDQQANLQNASQYNQYGLNAANLAQSNNQYNATNQQNAGANNLQANIATNSLNQNAQQQGIQNMGNLLTQGYNTASNAYQMPYTNYLAGMQAYQPFASMYRGADQTTPLYNNVAGGIAGGALLGAQLGSIWGK